MGLTNYGSILTSRTLEPWLDSRVNWAGLCIDWESARLYTALGRVQSFLKGEHQRLPREVSALMGWCVNRCLETVPSLPCFAQPIGFFMMQFCSWEILFYSFCNNSLCFPSLFHFYFPVWVQASSSEPLIFGTGSILREWGWIFTLFQETLHRTVSDCFWLPLRAYLS